MPNAEAKFIEVTTVSVGVCGVKSKQYRAMLNVQMIAGIQAVGRLFPAEQGGRR